MLQVDVGEQRGLLAIGDVILPILSGLCLDPCGVLLDGARPVALQRADLKFEHVLLDLAIAVVPAGRPLTVL